MAKALSTSDVPYIHASEGGPHSPCRVGGSDMEAGQEQLPSCMDSEVLELYQQVRGNCAWRDRPCEKSSMLATGVRG